MMVGVGAGVGPTGIGDTGTGDTGTGDAGLGGGDGSGPEGSSSTMFRMQPAIVKAASRPSDKVRSDGLMGHPQGEKQLEDRSPIRPSNQE
jgi:hypothetical protein